MGANGPAYTPKSLQMLTISFLSPGFLFFPVIFDPLTHTCTVRDEITLWKWLHLLPVFIIKSTHSVA